MKRTDYCGALREKDIGRTATMMGWVQNKRDMGGVIFLDLRDREGILQVVLDARRLSGEHFSTAESLRAESVISVTGIIRLRDEETYNPRLETGSIELAADSLELLSPSEPLPFLLDNADPVREDLRLEYRFLDLRRPNMIHNLRFRAKMVSFISSYLDQEGFLQVETPILTKSTPEGARDYLVPSRVHPGSCYALPQSPQIFKQLLMIGGIDRYYQVARCFRDEDLRADRQPEFTQVDMELSFVEQEDILQHLENMFQAVFQEMLGVSLPSPFPRLTWQDAMDRYGSDKPDLRFGLPIVDLTEYASHCGFSVFESAAEKGGVVRAINVKGGGAFPRGTIEELTRQAQALGAKGMAWIAIREDGEPYSVLTKYLSKGAMDDLYSRMDAAPGDFILFCADKLPAVRRVLSGLRLYLADLMGLREKGAYQFVIITDFPQFEYSQEEQRYVAAHHPFTMPKEEDLPYLLTDPGRVRAQAYDIVLNGVELGSGSIRIHRQDVQEEMFRALGFSEQQIQERFGFFVNAFRYGAPPHGGFAFGLDRLVMQMLGLPSLREVVAFPKGKDAGCPLTGAPGYVDSAQMDILGLAWKTDGIPMGSGDADRHPKRSIDVERIAGLSKLRLDPEEKQAVEKEMERIISFADQLAQADTHGVPETAYVIPLENVYRPDEILPSMDRKDLLANAPDTRDGYAATASSIQEKQV